MFTVQQIAEILHGKVIGDGRIAITGINSLEHAAAGEISFLADARYRERVRGTGASALIVSEETPLFQGTQVTVPNPALAHARVAALFAPPLPRFPGVSGRAVVHETAGIGKDVSIYPLVYVGMEADIGDGVTLFPGVHVGDRVRIGAGSVLYPNVAVLQDCVIGRRVVIHAGTVIGSDGFGYVRDGSANLKIPQIGTVRIDDDVEIGANSAIDRAALGKTWIKRGVKTDNLVQIAHNVVIGEDTVIVAQAALAGSVRVGRAVVIGGQVGVIDHLEIGDGAMIGSKSGVAKSVEPGAIVSGIPAVPHKIWLKTSALLNRLPHLNERLRRLEKRLEELERRSTQE